MADFRLLTAKIRGKVSVNFNDPLSFISWINLSLYQEGSFGLGLLCGLGDPQYS
jgi:hypothetical protein